MNIGGSLGQSLSQPVGQSFGRLTRSALRDRTVGPSPTAFIAAAEKILYSYNNPHIVDWEPEDPPEFTIYNNDDPSLINGRTYAQGGIVATASVPDGYSGPQNPNSRWIVTKPVHLQLENNRTFAPGQSKLFIFEGQRFDFKAAAVSGKSFSVRWSEDGGLTWMQSPLSDRILANGYCMVDFGSPSNRVVELIGEDEMLQTYGFNFDTGTTIPAAWEYPSTFPRGVMFGDSFVFGDGELGGTGTNSEYASKAMTRKVAELLGHLQIRNHGFRTNGFANPQLNGQGQPQQSKFFERMKLPTEDPTTYAFSEGLVMGEVDYIITPGSINDHSGGHTDDRPGDVEKYFRNAREMQPNALLLCPVGFTPPSANEPASWLADMKEGFNRVFGETEAQWIANGAYFLDGSRATGAAWIPAGAVGSSPYFGSTNTLHPNVAGHLKAAELYSAGLLYLAEAIVS